jgi:uncharacterized glyoxalase superfamily protein PhnB
MKPTPKDWPRLSSSVFYQDAAAAIAWLCAAFGFEVRLKIEGDNDAVAQCAHARARGARIVEEPTTHDYGDDYWSDMSYGAVDPEGHLWWITQRLRNPPTP